MITPSWVIRALKDSAPNVEFHWDFEQWLWDNVERKEIRACVEDCVCNDLDFLSKYDEEEKFYYQEGKEIKELSDLDKTKQALVFLGDKPDDPEPYNVIFWYIPKTNK